MPRRTNSGFTVLDLMIVMAILGLLATVALDEFQHSLSRAKRTEAVVGLDALWIAEKEYYNSHDEHYAGSFADLGFQVEGGVRLSTTKMKGHRYTYYLSQPWGPTSFYCAAVGQIDQDPYPDVVTIDEGRP